METAVQQLEKATGIIKEMDAAIVAKDADMKKQAEELKAQVALVADANAKIAAFDAKVKAFEDEIVALKALVVKKDEGIAILEAKVKLVPEVAKGTPAVADGATATDNVDYVAEYKKIKDTKEAGEYFKAHEKEIRAMLK
jgi:hypothetical protein